MSDQTNTHYANYSIEEMETLWELMSGKYGTILPSHTSGSYPASDWGKNEDTKLLNELILTTTSHHPSHITTAQWYNFLQKFEQHVRISLISSFTNYEGNDGFWGYNSPHSIPTQIIEVLSADPHDNVRTHLAHSTNIPDSVVNKTLHTFGHEPSLMLFAILDNVNTSGERLEQAEKCVQGFPIQDEALRKYISEGVRAKITKHPHITPTLVQYYDKLYGNDFETFHKPYANLLTNPHVGEEYLNATYTKLTHAAERGKTQPDPLAEKNFINDGDGSVTGSEIYEPDGSLSPVNLYLHKLTTNVNFPQRRNQH